RTSQIEGRLVEDRGAPGGDVAQMRGEAAERHRTRVRFPRQPIVREPLEQPPRRAHFMIEVGQQAILDAHATSLEPNARGRCHGVVAMPARLIPVPTACRRTDTPVPPPLPPLAGAVDVYGVSAPVRVVRDRGGVQHIYARNRDDLFFAQGYVQAQDRLFQMDLWRRSTQGRLAEVLGPNFAERDAMTRRGPPPGGPAAARALHRPH